MTAAGQERCIFLLIWQHLIDAAIQTAADWLSWTRSLRVSIQNDKPVKLRKLAFTRLNLDLLVLKLETEGAVENPRILTEFPHVRLLSMCQT